MYDVVRDRKTTPNSTEVRPNSTTLPSRIIRPKFGETNFSPSLLHSYVHGTE